MCSRCHLAVASVCSWKIQRTRRKNKTGVEDVLAQHVPPHKHKAYETRRKNQCFEYRWRNAAPLESLTWRNSSFCDTYVWRRLSRKARKRRRGCPSPAGTAQMSGAQSQAQWRWHYSRILLPTTHSGWKRYQESSWRNRRKSPEVWGLMVLLQYMANIYTFTNF